MIELLLFWTQNVLLDQTNDASWEASRLPQRGKELLFHNLGHFLWFVFLASPSIQNLSWYISRAHPCLILSVSVYRLVVYQSIYSLLEPAETVSLQLSVAIDFKVLLPTVLILSLLASLLIFWSSPVMPVSLSLICFCHKLVPAVETRGGYSWSSRINHRGFEKRIGKGIKKSNTSCH